MSFTLSELADKSGARLAGDGNTVIDKVAAVNSGESGSIIFVSNRKYARYLPDTKASAVIVTEDLLERCSTPALVANSPRLVFSRIALLLNPDPIIEPWISPDAVIADDATVDKTSRIEACAVIKSGARVGADTLISSGCVVENNVTIGNNCRLFANVTIGHDCTIGNNTILHSGAVIGADGFGFVWDDDAGNYMKVPQLGNVVIGNDVEVGANTAIDRGAIGDTIVEDGVKLDNLIQLGHNDHIGENTTISGFTGIAGSVKVGQKCVIGGGVGMADNIEIADNIIIAGRSTIGNDLSEPGMYASPIPAIEASKWFRIIRRIKNLDELAKRVKKLESEKK